jgi:autotransporter passenger strand-loop-strand repeat protein
LFLDSATIPVFDDAPETIDPAEITPLVVTKTLNNTLYQPVNFTTTHSIFGSPFTIGAAGAITVAGYNAITSFLTSSATIITDGTILATDVGTTHGNGIVLLTDGGLVVNQAQGKITGGYLGIYTKQFATITNVGIDDAGGFGIFMNAGGDVSNSGQIIVPNAGNRAVTTYNQTGIDLHGAGTITNLAGGTVSGFDAAGIKFGVGKIINNGLLEGSLLGAYLGNGGVVVNTGLITTNRAAGNNAVVLYRGGSLSNFGNVYGEGALGYGAVFGGGKGIITNSGTIRGGDAAIQAYASGQISNARLIEGGKFGIAFEAATLDSLAVINNTGTITGGEDAIQIFASGRIGNGAGGLIEGGTTAIVFEGVTFAQTATVSDSGIIESAEGTAGIAIDFGTAAASLTLAGTGTIVGHVIADGAAGNLLDLTGTRVAILSGIGTEITGFETIKFAAGASATIAGNEAGLAAGQAISGLTGKDEIILDGFSVTSAGYVSKQGFDLYSGATKILLATTGKLTGGFLIDEHGGNTTLAAIGATKTVGANEVEILLSGAKPSNAVISGGGILEVYAGGKESAAAVGSGGLLEVFSGGSVSGVHVNSGGVEKLFAGGTVTGSVIEHGGREIIGSGAASTATTLAGGTLEIGKGGTLQKGLVLTNSGGTLQLDGGAIVPATFAVGVAASDVLLLTGKSAKPLTGLGTAINGFQHITFATGAAWKVEGNITGIANGETFTGFAAGDALTIQGFGGLSGSYADGALDLFNNGAKEIVTLGLAGGVDLLVHGANGVSTITGAAAGAAVTLGADAFEIVTDGALAKKTVVNAGGAQIVNAGGTADATRVNKGGTLTVLSGGTASGGEVAAGGQETLKGTALHAVISGGKITIDAGGLAADLTVTSGGSATLASGGTISGATIAGGTLDLLAGGTLTGAIDFAAKGGHLLLTGTPPGNEIDGFTAGDTIMLSGFTATSETYVAGVGLELSNGARTVTLDLAGSFSTGQFAVTSIATGSKITLIGPPPPATTLKASAPVTTIQSRIDANSAVGVYTIAYPGPPAAKTITAALFGAAGTAFNVTNKTLIESIGSGAYGAAIVLGSPGTVTNLGTIIGGAGIEDFGTAAGAYISNHKQLEATLGAGIYLQGSGSAVNDGSLTAATDGLRLGAGGYGYNKGAITAAVGILLAPASTAGYILNAGQITASQTGILVLGAGSVSNTGTIHARGTGLGIETPGPGAIAYNYGLISAATGVALNAGDTLINRGTIIGAQAGDAVSFATGTGNLLLIDANAHLTGGVEGGGGRLELASNATRIGTLSLASGQFSGFTTIEVDAKAVWDLAGTFSAAAGITLLNQGTIKLAASDLATIDGTLLGAGLIDLSRQALTLDGKVGAGQRIAFSGTADRLVLGDASGFAGSLEKFTLGETIELAGISLSSITGSHFAKGILTLDETAGSLTLTFASPASFGKDIFLLTANAAGTAITLTKPAILAPATSGLAPPPPVYATVPPFAAGQPTGITLGATAAGWLTTDLFATKTTILTAITAKGNEWP